MECRDCVRYCTESRKCLDRKMNPPRFSDAVEVANVFGIRSICLFNDHRERLIRNRAISVKPDDGTLNDG